MFRRLLSDTVVYALTPLLSTLVGFLLVPIYTRTFSPSEYGALALVNTTTTLATIFTVFGLDNSSAVWFWEHPTAEERRRTFSTWFAFTTAASLVIATAAILLRGPLSHWLLNAPELATIWFLFGTNLVALNVPRIAILWFRMERSPWRAVLLGGISSLTTAGFGILFVVKLRLGLPGVIAGQAAGSWVGAVAAVIALRKVFSPRAVDRRRLPPMLRLSAPLVLMTNLNWVMSGAVNYFVSFLCSREDAGLYQLASSLASVLGLAMFAFDQAWAPFALSIRDVPTARRVYGVTIEAACVVGLMLAFTMTVFATPALLLVAGRPYLGAKSVLSLLALNTVMINIPSLLSVTFAREKVTMPLAKATAAGAAVTVVLLPIAAKLGGKEGAAAGVVAGTATILTFAFRSSQKLFPIDVSLPRLLVGIASSLVALALFLVSRPYVQTIGAMIAHGAVLVLCLGVALATIYRRPLLAALKEARRRAPGVTAPAVDDAESFR